VAHAGARYTTKDEFKAALCAFSDTYSKPSEVAFMPEMEALLSAGAKLMNKTMSELPPGTVDQYKVCARHIFASAVV
jgi:hypothetical protein